MKNFLFDLLVFVVCYALLRLAFASPEWAAFTFGSLYTYIFRIERLLRD